jgi:dolichol-phosphate mannosyltransferase
MPSSELLIVMPVYNEEASVESVVREWFAELSRVAGEFIFLAIDDGSTDETTTILRRLEADLGPRFEILSRENRGHGQSCLQGYRIAIERDIPHVLQIDSDGQSDPRHFPGFWNLRHEFDVIYGKRTRMDGGRRVAASLVLRGSLRLLAGVDCIDANVPYRLMNTQACAPMIRSIPAGFFLANVALAVQLRKNPGIRHGSVPIHFPPRRGGEPSVPLRKFAIKALELFRQLKQLEDWENRLS